MKLVLLYGSETWPVTVGLQEMIGTTDRRMLRSGGGGGDQLV